VLSVTEPRELIGLPPPLLLLLDALDMYGGAASDKVTAAMDSSRGGLLVGGRMLLVVTWRSPVRELGGDGFQFGMFVVEADAWYRSEGGGE